MTEQTKAIKSTTSSLASIIASFAPPPLLEDEDSDAYNELLARISGTIGPTDVFEEIWVRDVVDLTWESFRWRRMKARLIVKKIPDGIKKAFIGLDTDHWFTGGHIASEWIKDSKKAKEKLAAENVSMDVVLALTVNEYLNTIERLDRMTMNAEARRDEILRDKSKIGRPHDQFAQAPCKLPQCTCQFWSAHSRWQSGIVPQCISTWSKCASFGRSNIGY